MIASSSLSISDPIDFAQEYQYFFLIADLQIISTKLTENICESTFHWDIKRVHL